MGRLEVAALRLADRYEARHGIDNVPHAAGWFDRVTANQVACGAMTREHASRLRVAATIVIARRLS